MKKTSFNDRPDDYSTGRTNITDAVFMKSTVQMMVYNECLNRLNKDTMFAKAEVLLDLGISEMADLIWWEHILKRLQAGLTAFTQSKNYADRPSIELYPVVHAFFNADNEARRAMLTGVKTTGRAWDDSFPGRYLAGGYGKRTAGWVIAHYANGRFALHRATVSIQRINGLKGRLTDEMSTVISSLDSTGDRGNIHQIAKVTGIPVPKKIAKV